MTNENVNFDELAGKAFAPTAGETDFETLFAAVFAIPEWHFIADGEFPNIAPYCAVFPEVFGAGVPALAVFTDTNRARKFMTESNVKSGAAENRGAPNSENAPVKFSSEDLILSVPTGNILGYIEQLIPNDIVKIFFNPNKDSHGFHHDLKMMRPIYDHLKNKHLFAKTEPTKVDDNSRNQLSRLIEENADIIARFDKENETLSAYFAGTAAAMDETSDEGKEQIISDTAKMFEGLRIEYNMSHKLFRVFIESCLNERKILMPALAFAYLQEDKTKWEKLQQDEEFADDYAKWVIRKIVPGTEILMDEPPQKTEIPAIENDKKNSAESGADFDALSRKANEPNAPMENLNALFGAAFALENWEFIARGEMPNINPYIAARADVANGQQMIRAFTDANRLQRFAKENNLMRENGSIDILTIPTAGIIEYLEQFINYGVHGVWFNSDTMSDGFFIPIKQLRPIKEHLAKLPKTPTIRTVLVKVKDGLMLSSGFVSQAEYTCNFYARFPADFFDGEKLKEEKLEKIYEKVYGKTWRGGNEDGSRYVVSESSQKILDAGDLKQTNFGELKTTDADQFWFYAANENGEIDSLKAEEFQAQVDAEIKAASTETARKRQDNLANFGMSETPDGGFDLNLSINQVGAVNFDTSIAPFYEAVVPLLEDFQGTGDFVTLLRFEPSGKSNEVENVAENAHGKYLQIRRFLYLNPKNGVRIGVNSIHSNSLRHVKTNAELIVSIELCKNLDNRTAVFYHAFQGPKADVLNMAAAIQPHLQNAGYDPVR